MPHHPQPFFRSARSAWFLQLDGKQIKLGPDRDPAYRRYHELMAGRAAVPSHGVPGRAAPAPRLCVELIDAFLDWCQLHREGRTYDWYREKLQYLVDTIPPTLDATTSGRSTSTSTWTPTPTGPAG